MTISNWITIAAFVIINGIAVLTNWIKMSAKIQQIDKELNALLQWGKDTVQERKDYNEQTFQRKDLFEMCYHELVVALAEIKKLGLDARFTKIETQLVQVQAGIEELKRRPEIPQSYI